MRATKLLLVSAALLASFGHAQQTPSTSQPTPAPTPTAPCKTNPNPDRKPGWIEKKAKALACKQNKNLCDLPSSQSEITGATPDTKPCPMNATAKQIAPSKQQTPQATSITAPPATPAPQAPVPNAKPAYVCPPRTLLIANTPYCLTADQTTVDAIPLPPSVVVPVSPVKTPAQTTTKQ